jgi:hypothetical protein
MEDLLNVHGLKYLVWGFIVMIPIGIIRALKDHWKFDARSIGFEDGFIAGLEETKRGQDHAEALLTALKGSQTHRAV